MLDGRVAPVRQLVFVLDAGVSMVAALLLAQILSG